MEEKSEELVRITDYDDRFSYNSDADQEQREEQLKNEVIFGKQEIAEIKLIDGTPDFIFKNHRKYKGKTKEEAKTEILNSVRGNLKKLWTDPRYKYLVESFFYSNGFFSLTNLSDPDDRTATPESLFNNDLVDDEILELILRDHIEQTELRQKAVNSDSRVFVQKIIDKLEDYQLKTGVILDSERIMRIAKNKLLIQDGLTLALSGRMDRWGAYDIETDVIIIATQTPYRYLEHTLAHEIVHALGARITILHKDFKDEDYSEYPELMHFNKEHLRSGLLFSTINPRFRWLNEAATENIALNILEKDGSRGFYKNEHFLVDLLLTAGKEKIDFSLLERAYFENSDSDRTVPHWKKFYRAVNQAYEPKFLVRLDEYVKKHGVKEAIMAMQRDWREITRNDK